MSCMSLRIRRINPSYFILIPIPVLIPVSVSIPISIPISISHCLRRRIQAIDQ